MKGFKKILAITISILTLSCCVSAMSVGATSVNYVNSTIPENYIEMPLGVHAKYEYFGTVAEGINTLNINSFETVGENTILGFTDGSTYTLPKCDGIVDWSFTDNNEECSLIGYTIKLPYSPVEIKNDDGSIGYYNRVTLPDGTVIDVNSGIVNIEAFYNLNSEYVGYKTTLGEDSSTSYFRTVGDNNTIGDSNTIGESEELQPTGVRGDINYDGKVDGKDLMLLKKYILGLITW